MTAPTIGIVSTGDNNGYHHPADDCLERLHQAGVKTYWTEHGSGGAPLDGMDEVKGNILVEVAPGAATYTVLAGNHQLATYPIKAGAPAAGPPTPSPTSAGFRLEQKFGRLPSCGLQICPADQRRQT